MGLCWAVCTERKAWERKLRKEQNKIIAEQAKWQAKFDKLEADLFKAKDTAYIETSKRREAVKNLVLVNTRINVSIYLRLRVKMRSF